MKCKVQALAAVVCVVFASCGSNSSDKETITTADTASTTLVDPGTTSNTTPTTATIEVPSNTKTTFETKYPQASNVRWSYHRPDMSSIDWDWTGWPAMDTADYTAQFSWDGNDYYAWYDDQGTWVGTVGAVRDYASLPAPVNSIINKQYNGYNITSVNKENDKNRTAYEISLEKAGAKAKLLVDENGKILKKKMMTDDSKTKEKMNPKDSVM